MGSDILAPLFRLNPVFAAIIVWFWGFGSLTLVGIKTISIKSVILKSPSIMIGDFFLLPITAYFIVLGYQRVNEPVWLTTLPLWSVITIAVAFALALLSRNRFRLASVWWLPHITFYWFMAYIVLTFLSKVFWQLTKKANFELFMIWLFIFLLVLTHQLLGIKWQKKFPKIVRG